jgi:hypothetical protein
LRSIRSKRRGRGQRLAADDCTVPVVHARRHDQVHGAELVLDSHEDDAVRRRRTLSRDGHAGNGDLCLVRASRGRADEHARRQVRTQKLQRVDADGEARRPVVGEHALPHVGSGRLGVSAGRLERSSASCFSSPPEPGTVCGRGTSPSCHSSSRRRKPSSRTRRKRSASRGVLGQLRALGEIAHARRTRRRGLALDDRPRIVLADAVDVVEPILTAPSSTAHFASLTFTSGGCVSDAAALAVPHERRRR